MKLLIGVVLSLLWCWTLVLLLFLAGCGSSGHDDTLKVLTRKSST